MCEGCGNAFVQPARGRRRLFCTTCRPVRVRRLPSRSCSVCGAVTRTQYRTFCQVCYNRARWRALNPRKCLDCATPMPGEWREGQHLRCAACKQERLRNSNRRKNVKRRGALAGVPYTLAAVGERDGWRCHLCRRKVNPALSGLDPKGPTIDHLVPVSQGGTDSAENVALAHRLCNTLRRAGGTVQLRMVG